MPRRLRPPTTSFPFFFYMLLLLRHRVSFRSNVPAISLSLPVVECLFDRPSSRSFLTRGLFLLAHCVRSHAKRIATLKLWMGECHLDDSCRVSCTRIRVPETHAEDVSSLPANDSLHESGGFHVFLPANSASRSLINDNVGPLVVRGSWLIRW